MNLSRHSPAPTRYVGVGLVVALHLAGIYALSAGLIRPMVRPPEIITLKPLPPDVERDPPLPEPQPVSKPTLQDPQRILVPPPDINIAAPLEQQPITTAVAPKDPGLVATNPGSTPVMAQPQPGTNVQVQTPGAVCSVMPKPDVPAINWSGEAVLQVIATVRGGRVVGSEIRIAQGGAMDSKTRRALQQSVSAALTGYQCQGDAVFQQDFAFRLD